MTSRGREVRGDERAGNGGGIAEIDLHSLGISSLAGGEARSAQFTGTKALMLAILEDGIRNYLSTVTRHRNEAEHWVTTAKQRSPFSFTVVCETLGLEPDAVRVALNRMREQRVSPRQAIRRSRPNVRRTSSLTGRKTG